MNKEKFNEALRQAEVEGRRLYIIDRQKSQDGFVQIDQLSLLRRALEENRAIFVVWERD